MFPFFEFILGFMVFQHIFDTYLDIRQHNNFKEKNVPKELTEFVTKEQFTKSQEYNLAKSSFAFIRGNFGFVIGLISIWYLPFLWALSLEHIELLGFDESNTIVRSVYFFFATQALNYVISLPFTLYSTFVIEERFGFNKQTMALFIKDQIKVILLTVIIGTPILAAILWIIEWGGEYFWLYVWSFITAVQLIMIPVYQHVIAPLFNEFKPLEEGELRTTLGELAKRVSFPLTEIFVIDGSTRSSHSNAYFFGFFKNKRIVIYDTLIKQVDTKGIEAIVGHELGHYKMSHNLKNIIIHVSHSLVFFYLFGQFLHNMALYHSFGFEKQSTLIGLTLFMYVYGPVDSILSLALNFLSRHFEYQADAFAVDLGYDLSGPLAKIHTENSGNLNPDPWYSAYHFSHPTLKERVHAMRKLMAKKK